MKAEIEIRKNRDRGAMSGGLAALALTLAGCAAPTPYQPADPLGDDGYTVTQVEMNRFRIAFDGNSITPRQAVDIDLLYLASQVTLKNGGDWFELGKNSTDKTTSYPTFGTTAGAFGGWPGGYRGGWFGGLETDFSSPSNSWLEAADIVVHRGAKPINDPGAYDAHLTPAIQRKGRQGVY
jgi:hypothetical protein